MAEDDRAFAARLARYGARNGIGPTATILQQIFEVDPLAFPSCHGAMRPVAFITQASVIDQILTNLRTCTAREAHAGPRGRSTGATDGPRRPWSCLALVK